MHRGLVDIINTPGYVTILTGEPGIGKTSIALLSCARRGKCTYITYAEPESSLLNKLKMVARGFSPSVNIISALSGDPAPVFSLISEMLEKGDLVIVDSLDAMFYGIKDEGSIRSFIQLIYGTSKRKPGSLLLVSEGLSHAAEHVKFVCDSVISLSWDKIMDARVRMAMIMKDRDYPVDNPVQYFTVGNGLAFTERKFYYSKPKLSRLRSFIRPQEVTVRAVEDLGYNVLIEVEPDVSYILHKILRRLVAADYLLQEYRVNYWLGPQEDEKEAAEDLRTLSGPNFRNLRIMYVDPKDFDYSAERFMEHLLNTYASENAIDIIDLLAQEDFAVESPVEYEMFVKRAVRANTSLRRISVVYGYSNGKATEIRSKYMNLIRRVAVKDGFTFVKAVKPWGPLYYLDLDLARGQINTMEMK
ncbi:MAG: RAD55 family ATPase [Nitrososphaeria archaeon]